MPRAEVANWASTSGKLGEGRKAALQPQPVNLRDFFRWKLIALVLTISILCLGDHFQWKKFSQSAVEVQFPGYRPFVLPTLFTRGSGNLTRTRQDHFVSFNLLTIFTCQGYIRKLSVHSETSKCTNGILFEVVPLKTQFFWHCVSSERQRGTDGSLLPFRFLPKGKIHQSHPYARVFIFDFSTIKYIFSVWRILHSPISLNASCLDWASHFLPFYSAPCLDWTLNISLLSRLNASEFILSEMEKA